MARKEATIGVIGGSGLYEMEGLASVELVDMDTPFGKPSDAIVLGLLKKRQRKKKPNQGMQATPDSLRSCLAPAIGRA